MFCPGAAGRDASGSRSEPRDRVARFPRAFRLTARRQFLAVYEKGRRAGSTSFVMFALPNTTGHCRLGITVTRKVGSSVQRNRIKRVLRDVFRRHRAGLSPALDLVLNARPGAPVVSTAAIEREFLDRFGEIARRFRS